MSIEQKRIANEKKFGTWRDLSAGGRCYVLEVPSLHGWMARYTKEVDAVEQTVRFYQEIFNDCRQLVEIHEKYLVDKGHVKVEGGST